MIIFLCVLGCSAFISGVAVCGANLNIVIVWMKQFWIEVTRFWLFSKYCAHFFNVCIESVYKERCASVCRLQEILVLFEVCLGTDFDNLLIFIMHKDAIGRWHLSNKEGQLSACQ